MNKLYTLERQKDRSNGVPQTFGGIPIGIYKNIDDAREAMRRYNPAANIEITLGRSTSASRVVEWYNLFMPNKLLPKGYNEFIFIKEFSFDENLNCWK